MAATVTQKFRSPETISTFEAYVEDRFAEPRVSTSIHDAPGAKMILPEPSFASSFNYTSGLFCRRSFRRLSPSLRSGKC